MHVRQPAVAGMFYEYSPEALRKQIESCFLSRLGPGRLPKPNPKGGREVISLVVPHAGYMYSGPVASHAYCSLADNGVPDLFIIIGPNHQGIGSGIAIMVEGSWRTPLGVVEIHKEIARRIQKSSGIIDVDESSHRSEHSLEVQIPFLQYIYGPSFKIVPISMMIQSLEASLDVGNAIGSSLKGENAIILASTDFTHYEPQKNAERKDREAIKKILELNPEGLYSNVTRLEISMCGPGPVIAAITASKILGASKAKLLKYATSGDVTGDYYQVVGYAAIQIQK